MKGLELSLDNFLKDLVVEGQIRDGATQPCILLFDFLHPFGLTNLKPAKPPAPPVVRLFGHADKTHGLARRLTAREANLNLMQLPMISSGVDLLPMSQLHI